MNPSDPLEPVEAEFVFEVTDVLDLHTFLPREIKPLVADYVEIACERQWTQVCIIHGRGSGVQRRIVHSILDKHPSVVSYRLAPQNPGSTEVELIRSPGEDTESKD